MTETVGLTKPQILPILALYTKFADPCSSIIVETNKIQNKKPSEHKASF